MALQTTETIDPTLGRELLDTLVDMSLRTRQVGHRISQVSEATQQPLQDLEVLALLYRCGPPYRSHPAHLVPQLKLTSSSLTARLDNLEAALLIRRERGSRDRRQLLVQLTDLGLERVRRAMSALVEAYGDQAGLLRTLSQQGAEALLAQPAQ